MRALAGRPASDPLRFLVEDRAFLAATAVFLGLVAPYLFPAAQADRFLVFRNEIGFLVMAATTLVTILVGLGRLRSSVERRCWTSIACAFAFWVAEEAIEIAFPAIKQNGPYAVTIDVFFLLIYVAIALGVEEIGFAARRSRLPFFQSRLDAVGTLLFAAALMLDFVLLPRRFAPAVDPTDRPAFWYYLVLDALLLARFLVVRSTCPPGGRWRLQLTALAAAPLLWMGTDLLSVFATAGWVDIDRHRAWDFLWFGSFVPVIVAARLAHLDRPSLGATTLTGELAAPRPGAGVYWPLVAYALVFPAIHLLREFAVSDPPGLAAPRRLLVLGAMVAFSLLAFVEQWRLRRALARLADEKLGAERELARAQKLEAIGRIAAGIAHDFNNLLTVVLGRTQLLLASTRESARRHDLEDIDRATRQAAALTSELLALGRRESGDRRPADLGLLLAEIEPRLASLLGPGVRLEVDRPSTPLWILIDAFDFERIVINLAANARDAMPDGGTLAISAGGLEPETGGESEHVSIRVRDTGVGMDRTTLDRLFEPFFTTKSAGKGSGLGLPTVYSLVRRNRGEIRVESRPGRGTVVSITLPRWLGPIDGEARTGPG